MKYIEHSKGVFKGGGVQTLPEIFRFFFLKSEGNEIEKKKDKKGMLGGGGLLPITQGTCIFWELIFFRVGLRNFHGGLRNFRGVEKFSGGVEKFSWGVEKFSGWGVEKFSGGGVEKFLGGVEKFSGGLRNFRGGGGLRNFLGGRGLRNFRGVIIISGGGVKFFL